MSIYFSCSKNPQSSGDYSTYGFYDR